MHMATYYSWFVAVEFGGRTIAPHSFLPEYLDDHIPQERQVALDFGLSILKICKALVVCGDIKPSFRIKFSHRQIWEICN